jgi:two-component system CheB/CheR fusion protein
MSENHSLPGNGDRSQQHAHIDIGIASRAITPEITIVAIGASAGGLDACRTLMSALPVIENVCFIFVQRLDPSHESMLVDLLSCHTSMTVIEAGNGMPLERRHLYIIPSGAYISISHNVLRISHPQVRPGARLPFDFLLNSLAETCGARTIGLVLSGTGSDGCSGLQAVKGQGGFVIAQDPAEAEYSGMPQNAIATGMVDQILPIAQIPDAIAKLTESISLQAERSEDASKRSSPSVKDIIELLRLKTAHDFTLYKPGTLRRRIERRMIMASIAAGEVAQYLDILRSDPAELDLLAKDLLINVTSFFRDTKVFGVLAQQVISELMRSLPAHQPMRVWIAGCSTGEEAYSIAMLFFEEMTATNRTIKLQIFASDVDAEVIAKARDGVYAETIKTDVSPERLSRFFSKEGDCYRVLPDVRATVVFAVQDVLADPPFSKLDLISCRNFLIYLRPEAQGTAISLFHFALRENGVLLLGSAETIGNAEGRFVAISKPERIYRRIGGRRVDVSHFSVGGADHASGSSRQGHIIPPRQTALAELCRRLVLENFAPASVLINMKNECVYALGPTDRYLRVVPGHPTHDVLAMVRQGMRIKLRSALQQASQTNTRYVITGGWTQHDHEKTPFNIDIQPISNNGETLFLISFVETPVPDRHGHSLHSFPIAAHVTEFEDETEATRTELLGAIHNLEISAEEQKAINEEALSINEEFQSTNEELLTSKEELQSLNEELTALNAQLQETLERQRTTSNDLENVLYSSNVATIFLDTSFNIRFFTPATRLLFNVIPGDVGRPLADLNLLTSDTDLLTDAKTVLQTVSPLQKEVKSQDGIWYVRRIFPYRTQENKIEGVVITFADITERKQTADELEAAKQQAQTANQAKSRFLAAASHDLRQPLQTLTLLQGLLAKVVEGDKAKELVGRIDETLISMASMLNTLLDINQIETGSITTEITDFPINTLLQKLKSEFTDIAKSQGLLLHVVPSQHFVCSDVRLLEQILRNLLANAVKYTKRGKVLVGCRKHGQLVKIQVIDTGIGISEESLPKIFNEYHQVDNAARERSHGLGLGLSIVERLGNLLGHRISVSSCLGRGSVFTVEASVPPYPEKVCVQTGFADMSDEAAPVHDAGTILVVDDDPEIRELLGDFLEVDGHRAVTAADGPEAVAAVGREAIRPDILVTDYNLPGGLNGVELALKLRDELRSDLQVIILTGDISTHAAETIAAHRFIQLSKPMHLGELTTIIQDLLSSGQTPTPLTVESSAGSSPSVVYVVDDETHVCDAIRSVLEEEHQAIEVFPACEAFLEAYHPGADACLLLDADLPGMNGLELLRRLAVIHPQLPVIMITGKSGVPIAIEAMKAGAADFIEKPISRGALLASVNKALARARRASRLIARKDNANQQLAALTARQRQIMVLMLEGHPNKNIASDLGISQRTVENHRATIMNKTGTKSMPALARLALAAGMDATDEESELDDGVDKEPQENVA